MECTVKRKKQKRARNLIPVASLENLSSTFREGNDPILPCCPTKLQPPQTSASAECVSNLASCPPPNDCATIENGVNANGTEQTTGNYLNDANVEAEIEPAGGELSPDPVVLTLTNGALSETEACVSNNWAAIELELANFPSVPDTDFLDPFEAEVAEEDAEAVTVGVDVQDHQCLEQGSVPELESLRQDELALQLQETFFRMLIEDLAVAVHGHANAANQPLSVDEEEKEKLPLQDEAIELSMKSSENEFTLSDLAINEPVEKQEAAESISANEQLDDPLLNYKFVPKTRESQTTSSMKVIIERLQFQNNYHAMKESIEFTPAPAPGGWSPSLEKEERVPLVYEYDVLKAMIDDDYAAQRRQEKAQLIAEEKSKACRERELDAWLGSAKYRGANVRQLRSFVRCLEEHNFNVPPLPDPVASVLNDPMYDGPQNLHDQPMSEEESKELREAELYFWLGPDRIHNPRVRKLSALVRRLEKHNISLPWPASVLSVLKDPMYYPQDSPRVPLLEPGHAVGNAQAHAYSNTEPRPELGASSTNHPPRKSNAAQNVWAEVTFKCRQVWNAVKSVRRRASSLFRKKEPTDPDPDPVQEAHQRSRRSRSSRPKTPLREKPSLTSLLTAEQRENIPGRYPDLQPELEWPLRAVRQKRERHNSAPNPARAHAPTPSHRRSTDTSKLYPIINGAGAGTSASTTVRPKQKPKSKAKSSRQKAPQLNSWVDHGLTPPLLLQNQNPLYNTPGLYERVAPGPGLGGHGRGGWPM